jgi:DNA-binding winged helix-turn-helix (wHTH) protein
MAIQNSKRANRELQGVVLDRLTPSSSHLSDSDFKSSSAGGFNRRVGDPGSLAAGFKRRRGDLADLTPGFNRRRTDPKALTAGFNRRRGDTPPPATPTQAESPLTFGGFRLEADGTLLRGQAVIHLPPKELAALRLLLAHPGQIVTSLQLHEAIWGKVHVTADSVPKCVSSLRARLEPEDCIQTIYKRGYRLIAEVRRLTAALAEGPPRLAIPPFTTEFGIPEYLGAAIADETIARLSNATPSAMIVLARDSVFTLALRHLSAQQIGEALKADLVLTGTLRALPAHFRLRTEMIRVEDGVQIWVEDLLVDRDRMAGLETELVNRLIFRLCGRAASALHAQKTAIPARRKTDRASKPEWDPDGLSIAAVAASGPRFETTMIADPAGNGHSSLGSSREAYEIYQQGRYEWQTMQRHRMQDGLQHLHRATELDPSLIAAQVDLVHLCITQAIYGFMSPAVAADIVRKTAGPGPAAPGHDDIDLPPEQSFSQHSQALLPALAWVNFHVDRNLPASLRAFSNSAHLPHDPWITRARAMCLLSRHRFAEAIAMLRAALVHDPFAPWLHARLAWALHLDGQAEESVRQIRNAINLFPEHETTALYGAMILGFNGDAATGAKLAEALVKLSPYFDLASEVHAYALACCGQQREARVILERLQWMSRERFVLNAFNPSVHVALGDLDTAIAELRAANDTRCPWFFQMLADPRLKPLHGHPDFIQMQAILPEMEAAAADKPTAGG